MSTNVLILILGLAVIVLIAILLFRALGRGTPGEATFTLAELFSATVKIGSQDTAKVNEAVSEAAKQRGGPPDAEPAVSSPRATHLARVLWVDDNPDNNLYETVALERLGRVVTKATSTDAGMAYLSQQLGFALVITDLGRRDDPKAGITLIRRMQQSGIALPVVVYTMNANQHRAEVIAAGGKAVADTPGQLLRYVDEQLASSPSITSTDP
jgi:CheY-like chemotaxis protein